jgi:hypothetical protein
MQSREQSESQNGNVADPETITSPENQSGPPALAPKTPASEPEIIRITLDQTQVAILGPVIDKHRDATRITGLLAVITRSYRASAGIVTVELQILEADRRTIAALHKIAGR